MSSFLDRLKKKDVIPSTATDAKQDKLVAQQTTSVQHNPQQVAEQLKVDIMQTQTAIVIYAQIAGASVHDFSVTIEGDDDVVTIKGQRTRPADEHFENPSPEGKEHILEECGWGAFYRQIILPAEVDAARTEAKMREGVLMLLLPLKVAPGNGKRIQVTQI